MQIRVETIAELKAIKFGRFDTIFCVETEKEYYLEPNGSGLTPNNDDYIQAAHGDDYRYVSMEARGSGGGGGGGSPYPQQIITVTESRALTPADQGIIFVLAGGVTLTLPATADNGETYIIVAFGNVTIDPNGNDVLGGFNTNQPFIPGMVVTNLVAIDLGFGLSWTAAEQTEMLNYSNLKTYRRGDMVLYDNVLYISISNSNVGNEVTDITKWLALKSDYVQGVIDEADIDFGTGGPVDFLAAAFEMQKLNGDIHVRAQIAFDDAGTNPTGVSIAFPADTLPQPAVFGNANLETIQGFARIYTGSSYIAGTAELIYNYPTPGRATISIRPYDGAWSGKTVQNAVVDIRYRAA